MRLKKWSALLLAGVMLLCFTGCLGNLYDNVMTVDGTDISAGMYLMLQSAAYNEAQSKVEDQEKDVFKQDIEGIGAKKWIRNRTEELAREMICVERLAIENDVYLSETSKEEIDQMMSQYWPYLEAGYAEQGINETTFRHYLSYTSLKDDLFAALYGPDGKLAVPDATLKQEYADKYAHLKFYSVPTHQAETQEDLSDQVMPLVDKMTAEMKAGASFEDVIVGDTMQQIYSLLGRDFDAETILGSVNGSYYRSYDDTSGGVYSEEFLAELKTQPVGAFGSYGMDNTAMVYEKIPMFTDDAEFETARTSVLQDLRFEEFEDYLSTIYSEYPVSKAFLAEWYFSPTKLK